MFRWKHWAERLKKKTIVTESASSEPAMDAEEMSRRADELFYDWVPTPAAQGEPEQPAALHGPDDDVTTQQAKGA